ncbi:hypothetical protein [Rhodococcus qingshengii]|uniref:hypothetical protein n=1 Tax=Rhodococcus qingshengii TaxID=334542 RepID=UPI0035E24A3E
MHARDVKINKCTSITQIYRHLDKETTRQPIYLDVDVITASVSVGYCPLVGTAQESMVREGLVQRFELPVIPSVSGANRLMEDIRPLVATMISGAELSLTELWVQRMDFNAEAREARQAIADIVSDPYSYGPDDQVALYGPEALNEDWVSGYGISGETSDCALRSIHDTIVREMESEETPVVLVDGLLDYLRSYRDEFREVA